MDPDDEAALRTALFPLAKLTTDANLAWRSIEHRLDEQPGRHARRIPRGVVTGSAIAAVVVAVVASAVVIVANHRAGSGKGGVLSSAPSRIATGIRQVSTLTDTAGGLWLSSASTGLLTHVDPATSTSFALPVAEPGSLFFVAGAGELLFDVRWADGQLEARDSRTGNVVHSAKQQGEVTAIAATGHSVWIAECCKLSTPAQTITQLDASTLSQQRQQVVAQDGELPQLIAGQAGTWLMSESQTDLRRVDGGEAAVASLPGSPSFVAVGESGVAVAVGRSLLILDPTTGRTQWQIPYGVSQDDAFPRAIAVDGDTVYVAIPGHVLEFSVSRHARVADVTGLDAQQLSAGPHGVWAATDGAIVRLATR